MEMETGNGNWKQKNAPITGAMFLHSVLSHYSCILLSNGYMTGFMSRGLSFLKAVITKHSLCFVITAHACGKQCCNLVWFTCERVWA